MRTHVEFWKMHPRQLSSLAKQHRKHNDPDYVEPVETPGIELLRLQDMRRVS